MTAIFDFLPLIRPEVSACPDVLIEQQLRLAAREFCERTRCWRHVTTHAVTADVPVEAIGVPAEAVLFEIDEVWFDGTKLPRETWQDRSPTDDTAMIVRMMGSDQLSLLSHQDGTFTVYLFCKPTLLADELPDDLFEQHGEHIANGTLGRLLAQSNKAWSNPALATAKYALWNEALDQLSTTNVRGKTRAPLRTRTRY